MERRPLKSEPIADLATASPVNGGEPPTFAAVQAEIAAAMAAGELSSLPQKFAWFEKKLKAALTDSAVTSSELEKIARETDVAIEVARQEALAARERGLDLCADARLARAEIDDVEFFVSRMLTQRPRLESLLHTRRQADQRAAYLVRYGELKEEGRELAQALTHAYPDAVRQIVEAFAKLVAFRQKASALHHTDTQGGSPHLSDPELKARRLDGFTGEVKSLLESVHLYDWQSGREIWPPFQPPFAAQFALPVPQHPGAAWCSPEYLAAQQAERVAEQARMAKNYAIQADEQEARENKTLRENWESSQRRE